MLTGREPTHGTYAATRWKLNVVHSVVTAFPFSYERTVINPIVVCPGEAYPIVGVSAQDRQVLRCYQQLDTARNSRLAADQSETFQGQHHLMHRWRAHLEVALHIGLRWRTTIQPRVGVDEGKILALLRREVRSRVRSQHCPVCRSRTASSSVTLVSNTNSGTGARRHASCTLGTTDGTLATRNSRAQSL